MISQIWTKSKKLIPNNIHKNLKKLYVKSFSILYPNGYFKKFDFLDTKFFIKVNPKNGTVDNVILFDGVLDGDHMKILKNELKQGDVFVDVGANIGQYSLFSSRCVGGSGKVIAFEPVKYIHDQFNDSIKKNNIKNIYLHNKGCGNINTQIEINKLEGDAGGATFLNRDYSGNKSKETVEVIVLDDILKDENKVDFIKIDVEGFEYEVLLGLDKTIKKFKPIFLIEYSPHIYKQNNPENSELIIQFLLENNYNIVDLADNKKVDSKDHFKDTDVGMTYLLCK